MTDVQSIVQQREDLYGGFSGVASLSQSLKEVGRAWSGWQRLDTRQAEAMEMIFHKAARIINGDPDYADSWDDIAGYATLVSKELRGGE